MLTEADIRKIIQQELQRVPFTIEKDISYTGRHWDSHLPKGIDPLPWGSGGGLDVDKVDGLHASEIGGGDWQVLAEVEVASDCDYVDFTGLDINRDWFYIFFITIKNPTESSSDYYLFVEGDTTLANYYSQRISGDGTNVYLIRTNNPRILWNTVEAGRKEASCFLTVQRTPGEYLHAISNAAIKVGSVIMVENFAVSKTASVSNITQIRISSSISGAIGAGSKFILARPRS